MVQVLLLVPILKLALIAMVQVKYNSLKIHHLVAW